MKYFSIRDEKAGSFGSLFPAHTPGIAERSFKEAIANPEAPYGKYPEDFSLYYHFEMDESTGLIVGDFEPPRLLVDAVTLVS